MSGNRDTEAASPRAEQFPGGPPKVMSDPTVDRGDGAPDARPPLVVFVHIPKTAGTALRNILSLNQVGRPQHVMIWNVFKGAGGVDMSLYNRLQNAEEPFIRRALMVRGHFPLGVREYMGPLSGKGREFRYLTFLRDPVDRMLSHFFTVVNAHAGSPDPNQGKEHRLTPLRARPTLEEAIAGGYLYDNLQTRMLSGISEPFGEVSDEMLEQAKANLRDPQLVFGMAERFDESLVVIKRRLGLRCILSSGSDRVNEARPRGRDVPEEFVVAAEKANRYDIELHRYGRELFDAMPDLEEPDFKAELAGLHAARGSGPIQVSEPRPKGFDGTAAVWRERVTGIAQAQRLEWEVGELRATATSGAARQEKLERELEELTEAAEVERGRAREVEAKLTAYKSAAARQTTASGRQISAMERHLATAERQLAAAEQRIAELEEELGAARAAVPGKAERERTKAKLYHARGDGRKPHAKVKRRDRAG